MVSGERVSNDNNPNEAKDEGLWTIPIRTSATHHGLVVVVVVVVVVMAVVVVVGQQPPPTTAWVGQTDALLPEGEAVEARRRRR